MGTSSWFAKALGAMGLLLSANGALARSPTGFRQAASSSGYRSFESCPERCMIAGPNTGNWSVYPDFKQIRTCQQTIFFDFSLYDPVDDNDSSHHISACSSFGPDWSVVAASTAQVPAAESVDVDLDIGWWVEGFGLATAGLQSLIKQICQYVDNGHGATETPFIMFGQYGQATIGLYIGQGLLNRGLTATLKTMQDSLATLNVTTPSLAMQLCRPGYDSSHIFGAMVTSKGTFSAIQDAIKAWNNGTCLSFSASISVAGQAQFIMPLVAPYDGSTTGTNSTSNSAILRPRKLMRHASGMSHARAECLTVQVVSGDSCASLATKCGISGADFATYNPGADLCALLKPKQHVCCSSGDLPDFSPKPNTDGTCYAYQILANDNCDDLAAQYSLTREKIEDFNANTWGWNGCQLLFKDTIMCLSEGTPPFPSVIANAVCGPQKPGTTPPTDGSDISKLNPCPLNACCNIWGQCGITQDFCIDTNTGAPGTAKPGTYGCISNCGLDVIKGTGTGSIKVGYFEGYGMGRECLFQDASQIDVASYTNLHFAFGTLTADFEVEVGDELSTYQFSEFKRITAAKKILSFGGWDFSTSPATYSIFRNGVTAANRLKMATNIANFIKDNGLDGVDIDWEYPGEPDIPGIPAASLDDGPNYLAFLVLLKNLLPGKTVSIAAPSSYWYLKQFPINAIGKIVDYIVFMTYDLHGQWDANNQYSQEGCDTGNCLRSQVNLTETKQSLAMITKAGVPGAKIVVGVTSYGRSFKMADPSCWGPNCLFTGDRLTSQAAKGVCTGTAGYIANAEIAEIMSGSSGNKRQSSRVVASFVDTTSNSDVLVYDDGEWVSYMSASTKKTRAALYTAWGMGGTTNWATDLEQYHDPPEPVDSWSSFKQMILAGQDPKTDTRTGNWTQLDCLSDYMVHNLDYTAAEQWDGLNADGAWRDVRSIYEDVDKPRSIPFIKSAASTLKAETECSISILDACDTIGCPDGANGPLSGPAAKLVWNSLAKTMELYSDYYTTLFQAAAISSTSLDDLENKFAPIPPEQDQTWLLVLIDILAFGTLASAGPFFNVILKRLPTFVNSATTFDNTKDVALTLIGTTVTLIKDTLPDPQNAPWKPEDQDKFSNYMGQVISGWANVTSIAFNDLFNGSTASLDTIEKLISNGKLLTDALPTPTSKRDTEPNDANDLRANIQKTFFGYAIPALWHVSKAWPFVIDSGFGCDADNPLGDYLTDETQRATFMCYEDKLYYLASLPDGEEAELCGPDAASCTDNYFKAPAGLSSLSGEGTNFGGITKEMLIKGSVRTYRQNGNTNGGGVADVNNQGTIDDLLDNQDITTPGFIRIPVCSPEQARTSWKLADKGSTPNYPCDMLPGRNSCGDSTFVDQTSDASPAVDDCRQIVTNIQSDPTTDWTILVGGEEQREFVKFGSCALGVEATTVDGNADFRVGGQDVIDIINEAIRQFGGSGKVGAKGDIKCNGNIKQQTAEWGIY